MMGVNRGRDGPTRGVFDWKHGVEVKLGCCHDYYRWLPRATGNGVCVGQRHLSPGALTWPKWKKIDGTCCHLLAM